MEKDLFLQIRPQGNNKVFGRGTMTTPSWDGVKDSRLGQNNIFLINATKSWHRNRSLSERNAQASEFQYLCDRCFRFRIWCSMNSLRDTENQGPDAKMLADNIFSKMHKLLHSL